jgi:hypothetical protein
MLPSWDGELSSCAATELSLVVATTGQYLFVVVAKLSLVVMATQVVAVVVAAINVIVVVVVAIKVDALVVAVKEVAVVAMTSLN